VLERTEDVPGNEVPSGGKVVAEAVDSCAAKSCACGSCDGPTGVFKRVPPAARLRLVLVLILTAGPVRPEEVVVPERAKPSTESAAAICLTSKP
jgi:hypothetical protein